MSTVGYGDVYPVTGTGRMLTGFFILFEDQFAVGDVIEAYQIEKIAGLMEA